MNLSNQDSQKQLEDILENVEAGILEDEEEIIKEITQHFEELNGADKHQFIQHINSKFHTFSFIQHQMFIELQVVQTDYNHKDEFKQIIQQKDWKRLIKELQNQDFCQENEIPILWGQKESIRVIQQNEIILPKLIELFILNVVQEGYHYLALLQLWIELLSIFTNEAQQDRIIMEQIIGSSLKKQTLEFIEYQQYVLSQNQITQSDFNQMLQKFQFKTTDGYDVQKFNSSFSILFQLKTTLISQNDFEKCLRKTFNLKEEQIQYQIIKNDLIQLLQSRANIEELYFMASFYFLIQYCSLFKIQEDFKKLHGDLIKFKDKQQKVKELQLKKMMEKNDPMYQFLISEIIAYSENQYCVNETYKNKQTLIESQIQNYLNGNTEIFNQEQAQVVQMLNAFSLIPLLKCRQLFINDQGTEIKLLIFGQLSLENLDLVFEVIKNSNKQSLYQCTQIIEQYVHLFRKKQSGAWLLYLTSIIYNHNLEHLNCYLKFFEIEGSFASAQFLDSILNILEQNTMTQTLAEQLITQCNWKILSEVFNDETVNKLFDCLLFAYQNEIQDEKYQQILYQILQNIGQNTSWKGNLGAQFLLSNKSTQDLFNSFFLQNEQEEQICAQEIMQERRNKFFHLISEQDQQRRYQILLCLKQNDLHNLYCLQKLLELFEKITEINHVYSLWNIYLIQSSQDKESLYLECEKLFQQDSTFYSSNAGLVLSFDDENLNPEILGKKLKSSYEYQTYQKSQQAGQEIYNRDWNDQLINQSEENEELNKQMMEKLEFILSDILEGTLNDEQEILNDLIPVFQQLNYENQLKIKKQLQEQFQEFSFIKNKIFQFGFNQEERQNNQEIFSKLKIEKNWKKLLIQLQDASFCAENNIPLFWKQQQCLNCFKKYEIILELALELSELCQISSSFHYIRVLEIVLMILNYSKKSEDRNIIEQIVGSTLIVQMYHFMEYEQNLKNVNEEMFQKMKQEIQQHQLYQIEEIKLQDYDEAFQTYIKILREQLNQNTIESYVQELFFSNFFEISEQCIIQKVQNNIYLKFNIEECYFKLINFSQELIKAKDYFRDKKESKDRQISYLNRNYEKWARQGDQILLFLLNTILYHQDNLSTIPQFKENYSAFIQKSNEYELQLQAVQNKSLKQIIFNPESFDLFFSSCCSISHMKAYLLFPQIKQIGFVFLIFQRLYQFGSIYTEISKTQNDALPSNQLYLSIDSLFEEIKNKELAIYCFMIVNEINEFYDQENFPYLVDLFRIENSIKKMQLIRFLTNEIVQKSQNIFEPINEGILSLILFSLKDWLKVKFVFGYEFIEKIYQKLLISFFKGKNDDEKKNKLHQILMKLSIIIQKVSGAYLWSSRQLLLVLPQKKLIFLTNQIIQNQPIQPKVLKLTISILLSVLEKLSSFQKPLMLDFFSKMFEQAYLQFDILKTWIGQGIQSQYIYKYFLLKFYSTNKECEKDLLAEAQKIFIQDRKIYVVLFEQLSYFKKFELTPMFLTYKDVQQCYPFDSQISLEEFNLSLQEITQNQKVEIVRQWFQQKTDKNKFKQLIPIYFNLIKRNESSKTFLSLLNNLKKDITDGVNMKSMFQLLLNNSNNELKQILLKLWSGNNPVPLIYSNPNFRNVTSQRNLFCLNENLEFIFPRCFPIINLSLSNKQSSYGKTSLINETFYQLSDAFEVSDKCLLNQNTIDIMFDFCFNGTRELAVADVHGVIPFEILLKVLPLFEVWVIQMNTEVEFEENYTNFCQIKQFIGMKECCFVIRNSTKSDGNQALINKLQQEKISLFSIIDLKKQDQDQQVINKSKEQFSQFIFNLIKKRMDQQGFKQADQYLQLLTNYYDENHQQIIQIKKQHSILRIMESELNTLKENPDGFYNQKAFPIRSLMYKIKQKKLEHLHFDTYNKQEFDLKKEDIKKQIKELENSISQQLPTQLLQKFQEIFEQDEFYPLYLKFSNFIKGFNEKETQGLIKINDEILKQKNQVEQNQGEISNEMKQKFKEKLAQNQLKLEQKSIGIELFWREIILLKQKGASEKLQINPAQIAAQLIKKGENFEFLDGDSLEFDEYFLQEIIKQLKILENQKVLIFSILGPQSSGKSTILNKIFGCHFLTSVGRCTKGIYLQLLAITQKSQFDNQFDYLLILDSEGLQNPNQTDHEFDKKIALLVLAISDLIIINVKGDINSNFKNLVEMCIYTLGEMNKSISSLKQLSWCFNQNENHKSIQPFREQIQTIISNLDQSGDQNSKKEILQLLRISDENIKVLGSASTEKIWRINNNLGIFGEWKQKLLQETFSEEAYLFGIQIIRQFIKKAQNDKKSRLQSLSQAISNIQSVWQIICRFPDLLEFTELLQYQQDQKMKQAFNQSCVNHQFKYQDEVCNSVSEAVQNSNSLNYDLFYEIENTQKQLLQQEILKIKENITNDLLTFKKKNQIKNKTYKKYQSLLDDKLNTYQCNFNVQLFNEIKRHEREFQQKRGFKQLDDFALNCNRNLQLQQKFKNDPKLIEVEFNKIWKNITDSKIDKQTSVFKDFSKAEYKRISSIFSNHQYRPKVEDYQKKFLELSKSPITDIQKQEYLKIHKNEIESGNQFQIINNNIDNSIFFEIFTQPLQERLKFISNFFVNLNDYYDLHYKVWVIQKEKFESYLTGDGFYKDFQSFSQKAKLNSNQQQYQDLKNKQANSFLDLLNFCKFDCFKQIKKKFDSMDIIDEKYFKNSIQAKITLKYCENCLTDQSLQTMLQQNYPSLAKEFKEQELNGNQLEQQKKQFGLYYVKNLTYKCKQPKNNQALEYINDSKADSKTVVQWFQQIVNEKQGWQKIYDDIYDIIYKTMCQINNNQQINEQIIMEDNQMINSNESTIIHLISKLESKIYEFNKQFSNFGVMFSYLGERCIYYYSTFIIWRFSCYNKWKELQADTKKLENMRNEQLQRFKADIEQNKTAQSEYNAQALAKNIFHSFIKIFQEKQITLIINEINSMNKSCKEMVQILDNEIFQRPHYQPLDVEQALNYICDQQQFIERYVDEQISKTKNKFRDNFRNNLRSEFKQFKVQIQKNIAMIENKIEGKETSLKGQDFFDLPPSQIKQSKNKLQQPSNRDYDSELHELTIKCIQGQKIETQIIEKINIYLSDIFNQNFEQIEIQILYKNLNDSERKIAMLKPFIMELKSSLEKEEEINEEALQFLNDQRILETQSKVKLNMIGCQHSCPMCKRKCDQQHDINHKHFCSNGHQFRGMNGALINSSPSLFLCDDIDDDVTITNRETKQLKRWSQIKSQYPKWDFKKPDEQQLQKQREKMQNVWNKGIGIEVCKKLSLSLQSDVRFKTSNGKRHNPIHYIIMLDDSGSMKGKAFESAKKGTIECMKEISKMEASISIIMFSRDARVVVNCQKVNVEEQQGLLKLAPNDNVFLIFEGGTSFSKAFLQAYELTQKNIDKFEKTIILFYTDGGGDMPKEAIQQFASLQQEQKESIRIIACSDANPIYSLFWCKIDKMEEEFRKQKIQFSKFKNVKPEDLQAKWAESIANNLDGAE